MTNSTNGRRRSGKNDKSFGCLADLVVVIKGSGEMASGIAHRLFMANIRQILMTDIAEPICVRRTVAFSESIYEGKMTVEGVEAERLEASDEAFDTWKRGRIGVIVDPSWNVVKTLKPDIVVDAIMAKKNLGTQKNEAPLVIGVGPGFNAPTDVHIVVESNRGHYLGRAIYEGSAEPHTGIPGPTMGYTVERVLRSPKAGLVRHEKKIGDMVAVGDTVLYVDDVPVKASIGGMLRGLIREINVSNNEKVGDVDPRGVPDYCMTITEKARAIGGGVLEAVLHVYNGGRQIERL